MNTVTINNKQLPAVEYHGRRVVTLKMIDEVHQRPEGTARKRFNDNKCRFVEGEDYFVRNSDEAREMGVIVRPQIEDEQGTDAFGGKRVTQSGQEKQD